MFPDKLHIEGSLAPQERYRGIFRIPFYTLNASLDGAFAAFDPAAVPASEKGSTIELKPPTWPSTSATCAGSTARRRCGWAPKRLRFQQRLPGLPEEAWLANGIHAPLAGAALAAWQAKEPLPFQLKLGLVGQERLSMVPIGEETTAHLSSPWAHPSFGGRFLASERSVTDRGFDARWRVSSLVTSAREAGARRHEGRQAAPARAAELRRLAARSRSTSIRCRRAATKYGLLFIGLVLMAAFMFELFRKLRLHPVQYGLVGLSIALFFLLLLALSEKVAFGLAYAGAAGASVLLLAAYFSAVLGGWQRGASFGAYVALLYGALYGLLASESNALLLGALLIFGMLAVLMLATRKVDWYALSTGGGKACRDGRSAVMKAGVRRLLARGAPSRSQAVRSRCCAPSASRWR